MRFVGDRDHEHRIVAFGRESPFKVQRHLNGAAESLDILQLYSRVPLHQARVDDENVLVFPVQVEDGSRFWRAVLYEH